MRDLNGTGDIYFDKIFKNGIPIESLVYYIVHGLLSFLNLLLVPIICYFGAINNRCHRNLRIIAINLYIAFLATALGNFAYSILVLSRISDKKFDKLFEWSRLVAGIGPGIWRTAYVMITIERIIATLFYKIYEKKGPLVLGIVLFLLGTFGLLIPYSYLVLRISSYLTIMFLGTLNLISAMTMVLLYLINQHMIKLKLDSKIALTHRYQLSENIRVTKFMLLPIFLAIIFDLISNAGLFIQTSIDFCMQLKYPIYLFATNLYVSCGFFFYMYKDKKAREKFLRTFCKRMKIEHEKQYIRSINGGPLILEDTPANHFRNLERAWS